jgi:hypothetical protein
MLRLAFVPVSLALSLVACAEPPCSPAEYGEQCGTTRGTYTSCGVHKSSNTAAECSIACWGDQNEYFIEEHGCPAHRSVCVDIDSDTGLPSVQCRGDVIGSCSAIGFVRCEGSVIVECVLDRATNSLVLTQGTCGPGTQCTQIAWGEEWRAGCLAGAAP